MEVTLTFTHVLGLLGAAVTIVGALFGALYAGVMRRLDRGGAMLDRHTGAMEALANGQTELRGIVEAQGVGLGGRLDVLAQQVREQNGRVTRSEQTIAVMQQQHVDGINQLLRSTARMTETTTEIASRLRER